MRLLSTTSHRTSRLGEPSRTPRGSCSGARLSASAGGPASSSTPRTEPSALRATTRSPSAPDEAAFAELQASILALAARVEAFDLRRFELHDVDALTSELTPPVRALLHEAYRVARDVAEACGGGALAPSGAEADGGAPRPEHTPGRALGGGAAGPSSSLADIADIGFLASLELKQRADRLEHLPDESSRAVVIGECESALRSIRKALKTIDRAFARAGVSPSRLDFTSDVETALEVRRVYAKLRARVAELGEPRGDASYEQLQALGMAIATVVGWEGFAQLRVRDRMALRELQRRLVEWFRTEREAVAARRLWQDIEFFVRSLSGISRRQELTEHDAQVVEESWEVVNTVDGALPAETLEALQRLEGLDDEVDVLLAGEARSSAVAWRAPLERLRRALSLVRSP